ncbi:unknown [Bacteroides sp. CAG:754]|nr:unknown [Bacteroides sp. CAG:754]
MAINKNKILSVIVFLEVFFKLFCTTNITNSSNYGLDWP